MYLRLKKRPIKKKSSSCLDAVILSSKREGKTTSQQFVAYLGSIREHNIQHKGPRILFWDKVFEKLNKLSLPPEAREQIEERLSQKIPQPTDEERDWYRERRAQIEAQWKEKIDKPRAKAKAGTMVVTRKY